MKYLFYLVVATLLFSCSGKSRYGVDGVEDVTIKIDRYDRTLKDYVDVNSYSSWTSLSTNYSDATRLLIEEVLSIGYIEDADISTKLRDFYLDPVSRKLMDDASRKFVNMSRYEESLSQAFTAMKGYVPSIRIPHVYTQISGLNQSIVVCDTLLGISLDKYMGVNYDLYKTYFYNYQIRSFAPDRMVPDCVYYYLCANYPLSERKDKFYQVMLYEGKMHWITSHIVQNSKFEKAVGYSETNLKWLSKNTDAVWGKIQTLLYSDDPTTIRNYMEPAPCNADFGEGSPNMLGVWFGIQIIDAYMNNHPDVTIGDLLRENDYGKILRETGSDF